MGCRSQKLFLIAGIFGLVLLGKPAKTAASTVDILTSNVEDLAAASSGGDRAFLPDTNQQGREDLPKDEETQLPAESERSTAAQTANFVDRALATKAQETGLFNQSKGLEESIAAKKTDLDADRDSPRISNPVASELILPTARTRQCRVPTIRGRETALP
ncbi:hypothetical protein QT986_13075, partial [Microcoleus sp. herbarium14]